MSAGEPLIHPIRPEDDEAVAGIIRTVMAELGASGPGFALHDAEVSAMFAAYARPGAAYFVLEEAGRVVGGGGVAPLEGGDGETAELRKMYLLPEARGKGAGRALLRRCLEAARALGYARVYLETFTGMDAARRLYEATGFRPLPGALGKTGHFGCNRFYVLDLGPGAEGLPPTARRNGDR
jgi:putative acetyltransferase